MLHLSKRDGAAIGVGGRITFKKNVQESYYIFRITKQISSNFKIGQEMTVEASDKSSAIEKLSVEFGITTTETHECTTFIKSIVSDNNAYSELYCFSAYGGANNGEVYWTKNDLKLKFNQRWAEGSDMIITITF